MILDEEVFGHLRCDPLLFQFLLYGEDDLST